MDKYESLADDKLVALILGGDADAAAHVLIFRCGPGLKYLVRVKYRTLGVEFNEIVSELYMLLRRNGWRALQSFRGANTAGKSCELTHYIHVIAARWLSRKMGKTVKETSGRVSLDEVGSDVAVPVPDSEPPLTMSELIETLMDLPDPIDRAVLTLYKIEGKPVAEVAQLLNTSTSNVYTRCSRALKALRGRLCEGKRA